jgi:hypothetical protein
MVVLHPAIYFSEVRFPPNSLNEKVSVG